jgi:hypothetical protein
MHKKETGDGEITGDRRGMGRSAEAMGDMEIGGSPISLLTGDMEIGGSHHLPSYGGYGDRREPSSPFIRGIWRSAEPSLSRATGRSVVVTE